MNTYIYLDYLYILGQLVIANIASTETRHTIATLFAEIGYEDRATAEESLREFIQIYHHDSQAAMRVLAYAHKQFMQIG